MVSKLKIISLLSLAIAICTAKLGRAESHGQGSKLIQQSNSEGMHPVEKIISISLAVVELESSDLLTYSYYKERKKKISKRVVEYLINDANLVWKQCGIRFELTHFAKTKIEKVAKLRPTDLEANSRYQQLAKENVADGKTIPEEMKATLKYIADIEVLADKISLSLPKEKFKSVPVVFLPSVSELIVDDATPFGMTIPSRFQSNFLKKVLSSYNSPPPTKTAERNPESFERVLAVLYGYDAVEKMKEEKFKGLSGLALTEEKRRAGLDYYSVLAHEFGHLFQLSHDGELGENLMGGESNFISADVCRVARERAEKLAAQLS